MQSLGRQTEDIVTQLRKHLLERHLEAFREDGTAP